MQILGRVVEKKHRRHLVSDSISSFGQFVVDVNRAFQKTAKVGSDIRFGAALQVK